MIECSCFLTPEKYWVYHYSAVEPGSQWEWNPDCLIHTEEVDVPIFNALIKECV